MRFEGIIRKWNDERGFGFIEPAHGDQEIFLHIKEYRGQRGRPTEGQRVTFAVELNPEGKKRARDVQPAHVVQARRPPRRNGVAQWGTASYFAIGAFLLLFLIVAIAWRVPGWVVGLYAVASVVAFVGYAADKAAAVAGRWRVPEQTLIVLGLLGGWPGAIVAQQLLRHKSIKVRFRSSFWTSVLINVVAFVVVASPAGQRLIGLFQR